MRNWTEDDLKQARERMARNKQGNKPQPRQTPSNLTQKPQKVSRGRNKFGAVKTTVDGIVFDSKKEAERYQELCLMQVAGEIKELELQKRFSIMVEGIKICDYICDFVYKIQGKWILEDVKGWKSGHAYAMFKLKARLILVIYGYEIKEI